MTLQPIPATNSRLNSLIHQADTEVGKASTINKPSTAKHVSFPSEGISLPPPLLSTILKEVMAKANSQAKKKSKYRRTRTARPKMRDEKAVIGSSCTWGDKELDRFNVDVLRNVAVEDMIPSRFFNFVHIENYEECLIRVHCQKLTNR